MKVDRSFNSDEYVKEITGKEFKDSGALWFVNSILHLFGMALTYNPDTGELKANICRFRGFTEDINDKGYANLSKYLLDNISEINKDND